MKTDTNQSVEQIRPLADRKSAFHRLVSGISGPLGMFIELLWNSYEHGKAEHIWITISGRGNAYEVVVTDDGIGMDKHRRQRSLSLAITDEAARGRNYQDLGAKRMAAEFRHCRIDTISLEEKAKAERDGKTVECATMDFDWDELFEILATDSGRTIDAIFGKPNWQALALPAGSTGTRIHLTGVRDRRPRFTAETIRKRLPEELPPKLARKVFVNGLPLEARKIVGEELHVEIESDTLGKVEFALYIPRVQSSTDVLKIGPFEGICDWRQFYRQIPEDIAGGDIQILNEGVFGEIYVEALRGFVSSSRRDFEPELFADPIIEEVVAVIRDEVISEVKRFLGVIKKSQVNERDKRVLARVAEYARALGDDDEEDAEPPRKSTLKLNYQSLELLPKAKRQVISVVKHNPDLTLRWDISKAGGETKVHKDGREVVYLAGQQTGHYRLTCYYEEEPRTRTHVEISIVSQKVLRVDPSRITTTPQREVTLRAVNYEDDSPGEQSLRWRLANSDTEGRFVVTVQGRKQLREKGYGAEVVYRAGSVLGTYRIELYVEGDRKKITYCDVTIIEASQATDDDEPSNRDWIIGGERYKVSFEDMDGAPILSKLIERGGRKEILCNRLHEVAKHVEEYRGEDGLVELMWGQILMQHIDYVSRAHGELLTQQEKTRRFADLYAKTIERLKERQT